MDTYYVQVVNHLLGTYTTDDIIAEADTEIVRFIRVTNMSALQYSDVPWMKTLHFPQEKDEYLLRKFF